MVPELSTKFKFLLNVFIKDNGSQSQIKKALENIFKYSNEVMKTKEIALNFLNLANELELELSIMIETIKKYFSETTKFNTKKIIIVNLDSEALFELKNCLTSGYGESVFNKINNDSEIESLGINADIADTYFASDRCSKCNSNENLINKSEMNNKDIFNKCRNNKNRLNCEACWIVNRVAEINFNHLNKNSACICLKCAAKSIIENLKLSFCSCCFRNFKLDIKNLNDLCKNHAVCKRCISTTPKLKSYHCYLCTFSRFIAQFSLVVRNGLFDNHDMLNCSFDYCDLFSSQPNKSELNELEVPFCKLNCNHYTCMHKDKRASHSSFNYCSYCNIHKLFNDYSAKKSLNIVEIPNFTPLASQILSSVPVKKTVTTTTALGNPNISVPTNPVITKEPNNNNNSNQGHVFNGLIQVKNLDESLPGYEDFKTISLNIFVPNGTQRVIFLLFAKSVLYVIFLILKLLI